jgi:hypothetical protein
MRSLVFEVNIYNVYEPFVWFWLPSLAYQWYQQPSENHTIIDAQNRTVVVGQIIRVRLDYPRERGALSPKWSMIQMDDYTYATGFLLALPMEVTFEPPSMSITMDRELEDQWKPSEGYYPLDGPPSNETLAKFGLDATIFWNMQRLFDYKSFHLFVVTFSRPAVFVQRISYTFGWPSNLLCVLLVVSFVVLLFGRLGLGAALTVYLGTAFFSLPFLLNYIQLGLGPVSRVEWQFYFDIFLSVGLAITSLILRLLGKNDNESVFEFYRRTRNVDGKHTWAVDC